MIWATVSSRSCFCFSIFGCKEYNLPNFGIDHLAMSINRVVSCVVGRGCLLWPVHSVGKTLLAFVLLHFDSRTKLASYSSYLLTAYFCIPAPYGEKDIFFLVLVLEGLIGLHRTSQLSFFGISSWSIDLDYCDVEWFAWETNRGHSYVF